MRYWNYPRRKNRFHKRVWHKNKIFKHSRLSLRSVRWCVLSIFSFSLFSGAAQGKSSRPVDLGGFFLKNGCASSERNNLASALPRRGFSSAIETHSHPMAFPLHNQSMHWLAQYRMPFTVMRSEIGKITKAAEIMKSHAFIKLMSTC